METISKNNNNPNQSTNQSTLKCCKKTIRKITGNRSHWKNYTDLNAKAKKFNDYFVSLEQVFQTIDQEVSF